MRPNYLMLCVSIFFAACATPENPEIEYGKSPQTEKRLSKIEKDGNLYLEVIRDNNGRVAETKEYSEYTEEPQVITFRYNSGNQLIERCYYKIYTDHYVYKEGRLIEMYSKNSENPEWKRRLVYFYDSKNRISKADIFYGETKTGFIRFEYDGNNNTTARKEYLSDAADTIFAEYRFSYTNGVNPLQELYIHPLDIHQPRNAASSYFHSMIMSSMPTTVFSEYQFDKDGYPLSRLDSPKSDYQTFQAIRYTFIYQ